MSKPKIDEKLMHFRNLSNIMKRYKKIAIYALPGEGKSTIIQMLKEKYEPEWNFYDFGTGDYTEPYVYELPEAFLPEALEEVLPPVDIIYGFQYSREYKESISGITFGDMYRPLSDYLREMKYERAKKCNISGRRFKSMNELRKALQGVI